MKQLIALVFTVSGLITSAQSTVGLLFGNVTDSAGSPVANHVVTVTAAPTPGTAGIAFTNTYTTSTSGYFGDSLILPGLMGSVVVSIIDCNGATLSNTYNYSPNTGSVLTMNSPFVLCANGSGGGTALTCTALFYPDSNQAAAGMVYLVNASSVAYSGPAATTSTAYAWDFGDGGTATGPFPNHFYSAPGSFYVCLTAATTTSNGLTCTDTYCDSLTIDSTGFLVFKTGSGWTLQVIDASQLQIHERPQPDIMVAPNPSPAGQSLHVVGAVCPTHIELLDLNGRLLFSGEGDRIPTTNLAPGTYVLRCHTARGTTASTVVITAP
jgi:hypothetical protein